ncbi:putative FAD-dependent oxidoreductase LodB [Actinomadura rubteroloni]|uniref:Putative FAD-dependent oxidoreductase LodB n=1 Tax=Actinomadura rubteroloni TaxID=1926885 RepID=A0A2P4UIU3_9ACTN|nr:tryptophan 7-halogenase [Actinomadura rubteroloni]POM24974.1 putative FAD-dependent oxidoreductase LodB [Actinomadura rubteroloni]
MGTEGHEEFDVVVVGGGPGGSTLGTLVAMQGHDVLLLEKETFPRYQIGESLLPSTIHGVCRMTGATDKIIDAGFMLKHGGTFRWGANPEPWTFSFSVSPRTAGPTSTAFQVERSKFDKILLDNAAEKGVQVRQQASVQNVVEEDGRVVGVVYTDASGERHEVRAKWVVDASGNRSGIHKAVGGKREYSDFFRSLALFGYFENGKRMAEPTSGNILCVAFDSGWFWYIPLSDTLTSVGVVVRHDMAEKIQGDPEKALNSLIAECPMIKDFLSDATRVTTGQYGEIRVRKDYSYRQTKFWKPGLVLVGDAACFVDPVFSSGVHLATYGALLAARSINSVLAGTVDQEKAFEEFEARYVREYSVFYEFLMSFYDMHVDEDSYFWSAKKVTQNQYGELESFVDLVAGVSSAEFGLNDAESAALRFKKASAEFAGAVDAMAAEGDSMVPLFKSSVVRQAMQESGQVQGRALLGADLGPDTPMFPGGLVTSDDGMLWQAPAQG